MAVVAAYPGPQCFRDGGRRGKSGICRLCCGPRIWGRRRGLRCEWLFRECCGSIFRSAPQSGGVWGVMFARTFGAGIVLRAVFSPIFFGGVRADARACFSGLRAGKNAVDVGCSERESGDRRLLRRRMRCGTFRSCAVRCRRGACQHVCSLCADVLCRRDAGP